MRMHKILFVDDESYILSSIRRSFFREKEIQVYTALSGKEGLEILSKEPIDLVCADHIMPEMNGIEFLNKVKDRYPHILRIILTGSNDIQLVIDAINKGEVYKYLFKPWNDLELKTMIKDALAYYDTLRKNKGFFSAVQKQTSIYADNI